MSNAETVLKTIKERDIRYVDLRFTDPRGKLQHLTMDCSIVDEDMFADGVMFDGSSIAGWKAINESDMTLMPDPDDRDISIRSTAQTTMAIFCDILEPGTGEGYERDPRMTAPRLRKPTSSRPASATPCLSARKPSSSCSTMSASRPTPTTRASSSTPSNCRYNSGAEYEDGQHGSPAAHEGRLLPGKPGRFSAQDIRSEMLTVMARHGRRNGEAPPRGRRRAA